ncbi:MAG: AAA family ATPase [Solirubrobacterales bacterium]|nr:AAA family ATPase [Solirubrobacterales bacterium]
MGTAEAMLGRAFGGQLLERERELALLDGAIEETASGGSSLVVIEGASGIGKTRLLAEARARAAPADVMAFTARGGELEREFAFGVVRQLFEGYLLEAPEPERALAGPAAAARRIFTVAEREDNQWRLGGSDPSFASLHGVYWLVVNMCAERPLMIAVDDLQWSDMPSLRFMAYLVHRLEGLPVMVACSVRSTKGTVEDPLLAEVVTDPASVVLHPRPLGRDGVAALVSERLGAEADEQFAAGCHTATAGNPLLLVQLLQALEAERVLPDAEHVRMVADVGPTAVSRAVLVRIARLGDEALAVARAMSVLGDGPELSLVAAMAGLDDARSGSGLEALLRADILRVEPKLGFEHPLVAAVVYRDMAPVQRGREHQRAARLLIQAGAPIEQVAAHLLAVPPGANGWVVKELVRAGEDAFRAGAAESAVAYLRRAAAEPPPAEERAQVLLKLGHAEFLTRGPDAAKHLLEAYELLEDPVERGSVALTLARALLLTRQAPAAASIAAGAAADLPPHLTELRTELKCVEAMAVFVRGRGGEKLGSLSALRTERLGDGLASKMLTTMLAREGTFAGATSDACAQLASEALTGGELIAAENGSSAIVALTTLARADRDEALEAWQPSLTEAHRRGSLQAKAGISLGIGFTLYRRGELADAEHWLRTADDEYALWNLGPDPPMTHCVSLLALVLLEQGELVEARAQLERCTDPGDSSEGSRYWLNSLLELLIAEGAFERALAVADDFARRFRHLHNPVDTPWCSHKALALHALGRREDAIAVAGEDLDLARQWGAPGGVARGLRVLGTCEHEEGIDHLREAVATAAGSPARLEHAKALAALGQRLRCAGREREARAPLREAIDLAERCGARGLVDQARSQLHAAGGRPRSTMVNGIQALTSSERRVAALAADGHTNRQIAQALYITPKTVEMHLGNAYRKLEIGSRRQLAAALGDGSLSLSSAPRVRGASIRS